MVVVVLGLSVICPRGLVDFSRFEADDVLTARLEGVANCTRILQLKADRRFVERRVCFTVEEYPGTYEIAGDTITFAYERDPSGKRRQAYGFLRPGPKPQSFVGGQLLLYEDQHPRHAFTFLITHNAMK